MNTETTELEIVSKEIELPTKRADAVAIWDDYRMQAEKLKTTAETLTVTDVSQVAEMKLARATRLALKDLRVTIEKKRKELGEHYLRASQKINADAKTLKDIIEPLEARLLEQEEFAEREALRTENERRTRRTAQLSEFVTGPVAVDLGKLTRDEYAALLRDSKEAHEARLARVKKEADEAEARAKVEAEERERIRLENERLKKEAQEAAEKARVEKKKADAELARVRAEAEAERKKIESAANAEREAAEAQRKADAEKARKEQAKRDAAAKAEREASEAKARVEREAREKADAELAAIKAAEEKEKADCIAAQRAAQMAPEKEKLMALAMKFRRIIVPDMNTLKGIDTVHDIENKVEEFAAWIEQKAASL